MAMATRYIGKPLKRKEDPRLIQGLGHYVDDLQLAGMPYVGLVRSPYAHARIRLTNTSKAQSPPGVALVLTGADSKGTIGPVPFAAQLPDVQVALRAVLGYECVRFGSQP